MKFSGSVNSVPSFARSVVKSAAELTTECTEFFTEGAEL
jgi:hypothetical protein